MADYAADPTVTAALMAAVVGVSESIKVGIAKIGKNGSTTKQAELLAAVSDIEDKVQDLQSVANRILDLHEHYDEDGIPMWYVPRSWASTQQNIATTLASVAENQRRSFECLERMERNQN